MSGPIVCDLLVIGAGPAGSALAAHAAAAGMRVVVAEALRHPRAKACAEYASPRLPRELQALGLAPAAWAHAAVPVAGMDVVTATATIPLRYADRHGPQPAWGVDRAGFDALLVEHAAARGAQVLERMPLRTLRMEGGRVAAATLGAGAARGVDVRAALLAGADGARSRTARLLGVERTVGWPRRLGLVAHYDGVPQLDGRGEMHVGRGWYVGLAPRPGGQLNVGMALPMDGDRRPADERFDAALSALPAVAERLAGARRRTRVRGVAPIGHRAAKVAGPGWLLVGDAAGFIDPFTGEGIYRALRSARAAAAAALTSDPAQAYREERRRAFAAKDLLTWLVQGFLAAPPVFEYAATRLARRSAVRERLAAALGDCRPASDALAPAALLGMLRP